MFKVNIIFVVVSRKCFSVDKPRGLQRVDSKDVISELNVNSSVVTVKGTFTVTYAAIIVIRFDITVENRYHPRMCQNEA